MAQIYNNYDGTPVDRLEKIWRYIDFSKFMSLLEGSNLHFARIDTLGDDWEYTIPAQDLAVMDSFAEQSRDTLLAKIDPSNAKEIQNINEYYEQLRMARPTFIEEQKSRIFVNCWHASEHESFGMWKSYLNGEMGVAMQTTIQRLYGQKNMKHSTVSMGKVRYVDHGRLNPVSQDRKPLSFNVIDFAYNKKLEYSFEHEFRAIIFSTGTMENDNPTEGRSWYKDHMKIRVDLSNLFESVYIAPNSPPWFGKLVESILKRYNLNIPVHTSGLASKPQPYPVRQP